MLPSLGKMLEGEIQEPVWDGGLTSGIEPNPYTRAARARVVYK